MSERVLNRAYLSLGSNIDPERHLCRAVRELRRHGRIAAVSRVWQTAPVGDTNQADFLNGAVLLETGLSAAELCLDAIPQIERSLGRVRNPDNVNAPRTIDIDLSLFNRETLTVGHRTIPDPDILERDFVAIPLAELDPQYVHPVEGRTLAAIAADFDAEGPAMCERPDVILAAKDSAVDKHSAGRPETAKERHDVG